MLLTLKIISLVQFTKRMITKFVHRKWSKLLKFQNYLASLFRQAHPSVLMFLHHFQTPAFATNQHHLHMLHLTLVQLICSTAENVNNNMCSLREVILVKALICYIKICG